MLAFLRKSSQFVLCAFGGGGGGGEMGTFIPFPYSAPPSGTEVMSDYAYGI